MGDIPGAGVSGGVLAAVEKEITRGGMRLKLMLRDADFRFVEKLLYEQKTHDSAIAELEAELAEMMPNCSTSIVRFSHDKPHRKNSEPEEWTIKRSESVRGKYLQDEIRKRKRHQKAISEAMLCLDDLESRLVWLKYHLEKSSRDCWRTMGLQKSRFYEIRGEVVFKVGRYLGLD